MRCIQVESFPHPSLTSPALFWIVFLLVSFTRRNERHYYHLIHIIVTKHHHYGPTILFISPVDRQRCCCCRCFARAIGFKYASEVYYNVGRRKKKWYGAAIQKQPLGNEFGLHLEAFCFVLSRFFNIFFNILLTAVFRIQQFSSSWDVRSLK